MRRSGRCIARGACPRIAQAAILAAATALITVGYRFLLFLLTLAAT
jgi:hypothetical protein